MKIKLYYSLFVLSLMLFLFSYSPKVDETYNLNIHDTYYVFLVKDFYIILSIFSLLLGASYLVFHFFKVSLNITLSKIHIIGTILFLLVLINGLYIFKIKELSKRHYTINSYESFDSNTFFWLSNFTIIFLQLLFIINIFVALIKNINRLFKINKIE